MRIMYQVLREVCLYSIRARVSSEIGLTEQYEEAIEDEPLRLVIAKRERITEYSFGKPMRWLYYHDH